MCMCMNKYLAPPPQKKGGLQTKNSTSKRPRELNFGVLAYFNSTKRYIKYLTRTPTPTLPYKFWLKALRKQFKKNLTPILKINKAQMRRIGRVVSACASGQHLGVPLFSSINMPPSASAEFIKLLVFL